MQTTSLRGTGYFILSDKIIQMKVLLENEYFKHQTEYNEQRKYSFRCIRMNIGNLLLFQFQLVIYVP